jgi:hypothetical protein
MRREPLHLPVLAALDRLAVSLHERVAALEAEPRQETLYGLPGLERMVLAVDDADRAHRPIHGL